MLTIKGQSISGLIAIAPLHVFHPFTPDVTRKEIKDTDTEVSRFITARDTASTIMQKLHDQALSTSGADNAAIFENYRQLLAAPEFTNRYYQKPESKFRICGKAGRGKLQTDPCLR